MLLIASKNLGKVEEIKDILKTDVKSLRDIDQKIEIDETKETFIENAILKAKEVYNQTGIPTIADDSGLEIEALNGFPGVLSHRFLGENKSDHERNQVLIDIMSRRKNKTCYFTCSMAYYDGINLIISEHRLKGEIAPAEKINNGFGFDSIFLYNGKYLSDMTISEKNEISPRRVALMRLVNNKKFKKNIDLMK